MDKVLNVTEAAQIMETVLFDAGTPSDTKTYSDECVITGTYVGLFAQITVRVVDEMILVEISTLDDTHNRKGIEFQILVEDATEDRIRKHMAFNS